ncbi:MAG: hypothetical protein OER95_19450 [Acidimicrobiia bacterium]|nr:hypothetical protein [Acidimicrobiia bacterium]
MQTSPKLIAASAAIVVATLLGLSPAAAQGNGDQASRRAMFTPTLYADGEVYGTNLNGPLPPPTAANRHSFDDLYLVTDDIEGQLPVAEAAPGPGYNGGRWAVVELTWADSAQAVVLTSSEQVQTYLDAGLLSAKEAGVYFSCPLLPVK